MIIFLFPFLYCSSSTGTLETVIENEEVRAMWVFVVEAEQRIKNDIFQRSCLTPIIPVLLS